MIFRCYATKISALCIFGFERRIESDFCMETYYFPPTKNPLSLESDKGFGLYIVSTGLRLREDSSSCIDS